MNTEIILNEALILFQERNKKNFSKKEHSNEGDKFLKCHDIAHVVFGCDTSLCGEGLVKIWTIFGSDFPFWKIVNGYQEASAYQLFRMYSLKHFLKNIFKLIWLSPKAIFRARRMDKAWPFMEYQPYLNKTLKEIRIEFNILPID